MKAKTILPLAFATLALAATNVQAGMQIPLNARQHNLTIALSLSYEGDYSEKPNSNGYTESQKLETSKLSNKELLQAFLDEDGEVAYEMGYTIKGWSIVLITDDDAEIVGTYLVKKDMESIDVTDYFYAESGPTIEGYQGKYEANKDLYTSKDQTVGLARLGIEVDDFATDLQGVLNVKSDYTDDDDFEFSFISTAAFTDLSGYFYLDYNNEEAAILEATPVDIEESIDGVVTGTIKAANGKAITVYPQ
jgi:hypothetical protein